MNIITRELFRKALDSNMDMEALRASNKNKDDHINAVLEMFPEINPREHYAFIQCEVEDWRAANRF